MRKVTGGERRSTDRFEVREGSGPGVGGGAPVHHGGDRSHRRGSCRSGGVGRHLRANTVCDGRGRARRTMLLLGFGVGHWRAAAEPAGWLGFGRRRRRRRLIPPLDCVGLRRRVGGEWVKKRETKAADLSREEGSRGHGKKGKRRRKWEEWVGDMSWRRRMLFLAIYPCLSLFFMYFWLIITFDFFLSAT